MNDQQLAVTKIGTTGPYVVFLHGLFGQGKNFQRIARNLEPQWRSLLIDLPNHGDSAWTERIDYVEMADTVAATIRTTLADDDAQDSQTDTSRVHVVGHSMGGKVAMLLALRHPELVDRLVVVDISPTGGGSTGEFEHLLGALASLDLETLPSRADADAKLEGPIDDPTVRGFLLQNLRRTDDGDGWRWRANLDLLRASLETISDFPDPGDARFDRLVLWVAGERSDYVRPEHDALMRKLFPRVRQLTVKGAGHWLHHERPEAFCESLHVFFTEPER